MIEQEIALRFLVGSFVVTFVFLPIWLLLKPSPRNYWQFLKATWHVRIGGHADRPRWVPHYFAPVFVSYFLGQAVHTNLHYPLLVDKLGASLLQIGCLDAASHFVGAGVDVFLRSGPLKSLSRGHAFLLHALFSGFAYTITIGFIVPYVSHQWLALLLVGVCQVFQSLELTFSEYGVMRNDAKDDMVKDASIPNEWRDAACIGTKLGQLQVVLRYPATLAASMAVAPLFEHIYVAYILVGVGGTLLGLWLAMAWRDHKTEALADSADLTEDLKPGGRYFHLVVEIGVFNALAQVVRNGYPRMINLRTLTMPDVPNRDIGRLLTVVFGISAVFFWLSDIGSQGVGQAAISKARRRVGLLSFALLGTGHLLMGKAVGFKGLLVSAVFFGFGQATSTGLRTVWKDEVRGILRCAGHNEAYRKRMLRILSSVGGFVTILNSLAVGIIGERFGMETACYMYATLAFVGLLWTLRLTADITSLLVSYSARFNIPMEAILAEGSLDDDEDDADDDASAPMLRGYWHQSASAVFVK